MGTTERRYKGEVIGHMVKHLPEKVEHLGPGITITKAEKLGAFVTIHVDGKRTCTVPSKEIELILEGQDTPQPEAKAALYDILLEKHPINSTRYFSEYTTRKKDARRLLRRYELEE
jgi:hypothetical protein